MSAPALPQGLRVTLTLYAISDATGAKAALSFKDSPTFSLPDFDFVQQVLREEFLAVEEGWRAMTDDEIDEYLAEKEDDE